MYIILEMILQYAVFPVKVKTINKYTNILPNIILKISIYMGYNVDNISSIVENIHFLPIYVVEITLYNLE